MVWYAVIAASAVCSSFSMSSELIRPPPPDMPPVEGVRVSRMKSTQRMVMLKFSKQVKRRCEGDEGARERGEEGKRGEREKGRAWVRGGVEEQEGAAGGVKQKLRMPSKNTQPYPVQPPAGEVITV